jgi:ribose transport system permease protein
MSAGIKATPGGRPQQVDTRAVAAKPLWRQLLTTRAAAILALDVLLFIFFTALHPVFASLASVQSLLLSGTEALLLAVGLAMLLGAGIFDLSLGANLVLSSVVGATVIKAIAHQSASGGSYSNLGAAVVAGVVACIVTGAVFGLVNGLLVAYARMNALIATLGTLGIGTGLAYVISGGSDITGLPPQLQENFGLRTLGPIPLPAVIAIVVAVCLFLCVRFTGFGMRTEAIGSSRTAADRAGIKVPRHLIRLTILAGALAGLAGFIDLSHFASTSIAGHANDALNAVTAAVIGGTLLEGGKISILGAVWGTGLAVLLQGGLVIAGVSSYYQLIAVGTVLILAVGLDRVTYIRLQRQ